MTHEEYQRAASYWINKDVDNTKMEREELIFEIEKYIMENNTCALATGSGEFVRCTPIEYTYHDNAFWIFSEGGQKFMALEYNNNVCLAIYDKYNNEGSLRGMQISGIAEVIEPFSEEYLREAEYKKVPIQALRKLNPPINLIKISIVSIDFLNSDFKKKGYSSRQSL